MDLDREGLRRMSAGVNLTLGSLGTHMDPPGGRRFWLYDQMLPEGRKSQVKPTFTITQVAKIFFARSADWLRWLGAKHEKEGGVFVLDGEELVTKRTESGNRVYTLVDVERLAHALLQGHRITGIQFSTAIGIIRLMAFQYGVLTDTDMSGLDDEGEVSGQMSIEDEDPEIAEQIQEARHG